MPEKPILLNTAMVRAILDGRKTQTRRVIKPVAMELRYENGMPAREPQYRIGDILYVRETWAISRRVLLNVDPDSGARHWSSWSDDNPERYLYRAGYTLMDDPGPVRWHPSIHMPKKAARIFLKVTNVRAERLRSITEKDAMAEGVSPEPPFSFPDTYCRGFQKLWDSLADESTNWYANPWVWVYEFERVDHHA